MKVRDLIKELLCCDWDADVKTSASEDICIGYLEDGKTIFIDPFDICPTCLFFDTHLCTEQRDEHENIGGCECYIEYESKCGDG